MKNTATQTESSDVESEYETEKETREAKFDFSRRHIIRLREWCEVHWELVFARGLDSKNPVYFHDCCTSFSRRSFAKHAGHPTLNTTSIQRLPAFREMKTASDLFKWLLKWLRDMSANQAVCHFPRLNVQHAPRTGQEVDGCGMRTAELGKRTLELASQVDSLQAQVEHLLSDNAHLLNSSKHWCNKYQALLDRHPDSFHDQHATPEKHVVTANNFDYFLN